MLHIELAHKNQLDKLAKVQYLKNTCSKSSIKKFEIRKEKKQGQGTAVLVINGFLNENETDISEWQQSLNVVWRDNPYYYLSWESQTVTDVLALDRIAWLNAMNNAEKTGELLGKVLSLYNQNIILCGHSLGSRVIYYGLKYLSDNKIHTSNIVEIHLLGGAVGNKASDWKLVKKFTNAKIYNYYSSNDRVLQYLYSLGTIFQSEPIGRHEIDVNSIKNINTTTRVDGHSGYKQNLALFYLKNKEQVNQKVRITRNSK